MKHCTRITVILACLSVMPLRAQDPKSTKEDPVHEELRTLRKELTEAVNKHDLDALLSHLDADVMVTWLNGEVSHKPEGVRAYYDRMMKGPQRVVESFTIDPTVDELTHLYGETGVAAGSSTDRFKLTDGSDFDVLTRWSATMVKKDGKWRITCFHASTNMFDNPVLSIAVKRTAYWVAGIAGVVGLLLGFVIALFLRKRAAAGSSSVPPAGK